MSSSSSKNRIENVAIVGAGGNSGVYMVKALLATGKHKITALTRPDSTNTLPDGVEVIKVNYDDHTSLVNALKGKDALVITMNATAPKDIEHKLINAAATAGVSWVLPNAWGLDYDNAELARDCLIGNDKRATYDRITSLGGPAWTAVTTGFWYEWSLAAPVSWGFDFQNHAITLVDDGDVKQNVSTWPQVGRAVAALLSLAVHSEGSGASLEQFKNDYCYVSSFVVSQKDMLNSVLRVTGTKESDWKITHQQHKERYNEGLAQMKTGDRMGFAKALYGRIFYPDEGGYFEKTRDLANKVLGLPEEDIDEATRAAIRRYETQSGNKYGKLSAEGKALVS